jgi:uncharacterized protein YkwD
MRFVASITHALAMAVAVWLVSVTVADARGGRMDRVERKVVRAVNVQRSRYGLRRVRAAHRLFRAAEYHSSEMLAGHYFAHPSRNGGSFVARVHRFTRSPTIGEALAMLPSCGRHSARAIVSMWMHSPPHRAILLSGRFHRVGIARRSGPLGSGHACMVTADFSR